jgi:hypothetical protein
MPTRRPDNLPRGWLADKLRERTVRAKVTDPREREAIFDRITTGLRLGPGANTVRRRRRY